MSQKKIELKSHNEKMIRSSQHSKNKKSMADQLRAAIDILIQKQDKAEAETWKSYARFEKFKAKGDENEAQFHWMAYKTWSQQLHRLGDEIQVKLKAVQKYESPNKMEELKITDMKKQQYMKYGPSDEEE